MNLHPLRVQVLVESLTGLLSERLESGVTHLSSMNAVAAGGVELMRAAQGYGMIWVGQQGPCQVEEGSERSLIARALSVPGSRP